eukprot:jgi/Tetstr1/449304/TSEL_003819.t1
MGTGVQNASVDSPCHTPTSQGLKSTLQATEDKAVMPALSLTNVGRATLRFLRLARGLRGYAALGSRRPPSSPYVRRGKPIVSSVQRNKIVSLPLASTAPSPKLHGLVGVLAQQQKRAGGIVKHNTNAVKNLAATQAVSSPEPPAKKAKQPAKPAAGGLAQGRGGAGARAGGGALGLRAGRRAAVAAAATREQQAGRRGGPSQNRM